MVFGQAVKAAVYGSLAESFSSQTVAPSVGPTDSHDALARDGLLLGFVRKFVKGGGMATVKRIGPGSAFKIGIVLYAAVGLLVGIVWALFSVVAGSLGSMALAGAPGASRFFGFAMGIGAIIIFPICYGIFGGVVAAISAVLYNLVAGWVGGLEVEIN